MVRRWQPLEKINSGAAVGAKNMNKQLVQIHHVKLVACGIGPELGAGALEGDRHGLRDVKEEARAS